MLTLDLTDVLLVNGNAYDILNPTITTTLLGDDTAGAA